MGRGGGLAVIYNNYFKITEINRNMVTYFE